MPALNLCDVIRELEAINLQVKNGTAALEVIAQTLDDDNTGEPHGPALYFLAEGLEAQQEKLQAIIERFYRHNRAKLKAVDEGGAS